MTKPARDSSATPAAKRFLDVAVSTLVLVAGMPLWALLALLIRVESPGPVLYRQERVGRGGQRFGIIKFRSMRRDAEQDGPRWAGADDPRVTRVGRVLRRFHLDEVPQVVNVLRGEMSLVGPRPERAVFFERLEREIPGYARRIDVSPGVTGLAQINHPADESIEDVRRKLTFDLHYVEHRSLGLDLRILGRTLVQVAAGHRPR